MNASGARTLFQKVIASRLYGVHIQLGVMHAGSTISTNKVTMVTMVTIVVTCRHNGHGRLLLACLPQIHLSAPDTWNVLKQEFNTRIVLWLHHVRVAVDGDTL